MQPAPPDSASINTSNEAGRNRHRRAHGQPCRGDRCRHDPRPWQRRVCRPEVWGRIPLPAGTQNLTCRSRRSSSV